MPLTFEEKMIQAAQDAVVAQIKNIVAPGYDARLKIPTDRVMEIHAKLNWERIQSLVLASAEQRVADCILNSMATELATDVKQVLSNKELREDVRSYIRAGIRKIASEAQEPS